MKGLRKYIAPFAPDQSGASAVLYELGGILVICDAGGCVGNVCGFDEPRWFTKKSAIFSAGLRDMDAILGRDDRLVKKLSDTAKKIRANFTAVIGTPVPAVIGTDYRALRKMAEKKTELPVLTIDTTGMQLYDVGQEKAYLELVKRFSSTNVERMTGTIGVIGLTPLDMISLEDGKRIYEKLEQDGWKQIYAYGYGNGKDESMLFEEVKMAGTVEKNLVVSPSGLKTAQYLKETFGTPYEISYPVLPAEIENTPKMAADWNGKKILIIHQQVAANMMRQQIQSLCPEAEIAVATWFLLKDEIKEAWDVMLTEEEQFISLVKEGGFDVVIGDAFLQKAIRDWNGAFVDFPHFAVSGRM